VAAAVAAPHDADSALRAEEAVVSPRLVERKQSLPELSIPNDPRGEEEDAEEKEKTEEQTVEKEDKEENEEREVPRPAAAQEDELWFLNVRNEIFAKAFSRIMDIAQWERSSSSYRSAGHLSKF